MQEPRIINYIEFDGKEVLFDSLSDKEKQQVAKRIQNKMMAAAGFRCSCCEEKHPKTKAL